MKTKFLCLVALLAVLQCGYAEQFKITVSPEQKVVKSGEQIILSVKYVFPADHTVNGWRVFAYQVEIPPEFAEATGCKVNPHKQKRWTSVVITGFSFLKKDRQTQKEQKYAISTKNWPGGDYNLKFNALFRKKDKADAKTDKYVTTDFLITITE